MGGAAILCDVKGEGGSRSGEVAYNTLEILRLLSRRIDLAATTAVIGSSCGDLVAFE